MRRKILVLGAVGLLLLAGCSGTLLDSSESEFEHPPGVENGTLTNESTLLDAHREAMRSEGFVYWLNETFQDQPNQTDRFRVAAEPELQQYFVSEYEREAWGNGSQYWMYEERNSTGYYDKANHTHLLVQFAVSLVPTDLNATDNPVNYTVTDTFERDGRDLTVLEANQTNRPAVNPQETHVRLVVDADGVVWEQHYRDYREGLNGTTVLVRTSTLNLTQLGDVTVEKPEWTDEAVRHCSQPNASWSRCGT